MWSFADTPVKSENLNENGIADFEVRTAVVEYLDPAEIDKHPGAMPDVPHIITQGISAYSNLCMAYVLIQFTQGEVTDMQAKAIAQSIELRLL